MYDTTPSTKIVRDLAKGDRITTVDPITGFSVTVTVEHNLEFGEGFRRLIFRAGGAATMSISDRVTLA